MSPRDFIAGFIGQHEGGLSKHPADNGNWYDPDRYRKGQRQTRGFGDNVGSKYGVTAYTLNAARGVVLSAPAVAAAMANLTLDDAVEIGMHLYYERPGFSRLAWNRVTASVLDKAWGSGPGRAVAMLQQLIGMKADGVIGPATAAAYAVWVGRLGEEEAAARWADKRISFDQSLVSGPDDRDGAFINGWNNRTRSFLPGSPWWRAWDGSKPA